MSCKLTKSLTLEIQHCALRDERVVSNLSFVFAKCSQRDLPYKFRQVEGGVFTTHSSYGIASNWTTSLGLGSLAERRASGLTVHICTTLWRRGMIGDFTSSSHKILMQRIWCIVTHAYAMITLSYSDQSKLQFCCRLWESTMATSPGRMIKFRHSKITLRMEGWRITPFTHPTHSE